MQLKDYCINLLPEEFREDLWTNDLFHGGSVASEPAINLSRQIYNSEDFQKMTMDQIAWYETKLGIKYGAAMYAMTDAKRRKLVELFWRAWDHPSVDSVKNILDVIGVSYTSVQYRHRLGIIYVGLGEDTPDELFDIAKDAIRRHIPAHIKIEYNIVPPQDHYATCAEVNAMTMAQLKACHFTSFDKNEDDEDVPLGNYYFKIEVEEANENGD